MGSAYPLQNWVKVPIAQIEDLCDAVYGAGLEATQLSRGRMSGALVFSELDGVTCSSGLIRGRVALFGPLSKDRITLGIGLRLEASTRHWLSGVETGNVGVFLPGDEHDSVYGPGSLYASVTVTAERLEAEAATQDLILDQAVLSSSGIHHRNLVPDTLAALQASFGRLHDGRSVRSDAHVGRWMLAALVRHLARPPYRANGGKNSTVNGAIVRKAREYIQNNLSEPISVDELAAACHTSRRSLFRAFADVLSDTPRTYVQRLRLHRIRKKLAGDAERSCTITLIASELGIGDLGRMSGRYHDLFGERPSETLSRSRNAGDLRPRGV